MDDTKRTLAERVLKLFTLGDANRNNSEAESMAAVTKARELMLQHNVTMADLEALGTEKAKKIAIIIVQQPCYTLKQRFAAYDDYIGAAVEQITDTEQMVRVFHRGSQRYWQREFVGDQTDVAVAGELFLVLLNDMRNKARRVYGKGWSLKHSSYCLGYSWRLYERAKVDHVLALPEADAKVVALVLRDKKQKTREWMEKNTTKSTKTRRIKFYHDAHTRGAADATLVDLGDPKRSLK